MTDRYLYLCNQKRSCKGSPSCGEACTHTLDEKFAKNDPEDRIFSCEIYEENDEMVTIHWEV